MPPGPVPVSDSRFLGLLGNVNVMNGSLDKGRQSVFAILDRLRRPSARAMEDSAGSAAEQDDEGSEEDNSVMLYGPLVPSEDSEVELAASDIVSVFDDGETLEYEQPARPLSFIEAGQQLTPRSPSRTLPPKIQGESAQDEGPADASQPDTQGEPRTAGWFDTWKGKVIEGGKLVSDKVVEGTKSWKGKTVVEDRKIVKTKTRWLPSPDRISLQAMWWGYRLYVFIPRFACITGLTSESCQLSASACSGCIEQQAPGSSEACGYHNHGAAVVARPSPARCCASSIPRRGHDRETASALYWLHRRFRGVELGSDEVFR